jgi:hypothetical protein
MAVAASLPASATVQDAPLRSPENQVFQFATAATFDFGGGTSRTASAYLWIPPACQRVRGIVVAGRNVPEHWLVGHPAIRSACSDSGLAILWCCPTFYLGAVNDGRRHGEFLQQLLAELADRSGYEELARVPWLPLGESYHLGMVKQLVNAWPERCLAAIQVKGGYLDLQSTGVPVLSAIGTCDEWDQEKKDLLNQWKDVSFYEKHRRRRTDKPEWPGSLLIEGGSGHFECTEPMAELIARYIRAAAGARLARDGGDALRPVSLDDGYVAGLPVPGAARQAPLRYRDCPPALRSLPWYFTEELAQAAGQLADINWAAETQVPVFADAEGRPVPFAHRGITLPVPFQTGDDGMTFQLGAGFLDKIPATFMHAGTALGHAPGNPTVEWICGPVAPLGANRFRIALDRTWPDSPIFLRVWHPGDRTYRPSVQPGGLHLNPNRSGRPQKITFDPPADQPSGAGEITLHAVSDEGLPVQFFVRAGPAEVHGDRLVFTAIPPRSKMPLAVTVVAWQWGRSVEPQVQTAELVERTFFLNGPRASDAGGAGSASNSATAAVDGFNYVVGTQTFGPAYQFTGETRLAETAKRIRELGSTVIKFDLSQRYAGARGNVPATNAAIRSLTDLARDEPSHRQVLDLPFAFYVLWAHPFGYSPELWRKGLAREDAEREYREIYDLAVHLLTTYSGSGKTFFLGHWEGDGWLRGSVARENDAKVTPEAVRGLADWLNARQRAVDDAKRDTPHHDVRLWHYTEVNHVKLALEEDRPALVNRVLPKVAVDYVSYSSYDTQQDPALLKRALDYIESKLVPKPGIAGKRVFIGEYGFPAIRHTPEDQDRLSREVMRAGLEWGCPFVLYWELYNNEVGKDGRQQGFWMIDDQNRPQPVHRTHQAYYGALRWYVAEFITRHGRVPTDREFAGEALRTLQRIPAPAEKESGP